MRRKFKVTASTQPVIAASRAELIDELDKMYDKAFKMEDSFFNKVEEILDKHNADPNDSAHEEGFFNTMSEDDLVKARDEIKALFDEHDPVDTHTITLSKSELQLLKDAVSSYRGRTRLERMLQPGLSEKLDNM